MLIEDVIYIADLVLLGATALGLAVRCLALESKKEELRQEFEKLRENIRMAERRDARDKLFGCAECHRYGRHKKIAADETHNNIGGNN